MSVLSFPRIYVSGFMQWDVCTANNNDYVPVYAMADAALDWTYLDQFGITPENFRDRFRPWVIDPSKDVVVNDGASDNCPACAGGDPNTHLSSRWNYYGSAGATTVQYTNKVTAVCGGATGPGAPITSDPLVGKPFSVLGNQAGGRASAGRLIDIDPSAPWVSQILLDRIHLGDADVFLDGPVTSRMFSRDFMVPRNLDARLMIAGAIGVVFQTTIATGALTIQNPGNASKLLTAMQEALKRPGVAGVMLRMSAYNTLYYQNGVFNSTRQRPRGCCDIWQMYKNGEVFTNPAYSRITGTAGLWLNGELATSPSGHFVIPANPLAPASSAVPAVQVTGAAGHRSISESTSSNSLPPWGIAYLEIDYEKKIVSVDLSNTILGQSYGEDPFTTGVNFDVGPMAVGVANGSSFLTIGTIPYAGGYDATAYNATSGIYDVPFGSGVTPDAIRTALAAKGSMLALKAGPPNNVIACQELYWTASTDHRGTYLEQNETLPIDVQVRYRGAVPPGGTKILLAQYYAWPPQVGTSFWVLSGTLPPSGSYPPPPQPPPPNVEFVGGPTIDVDGGGKAVVTIKALRPGFPIIVMYAYGPGDPVPTPAQTIQFGGTTPTIQTAQNIVVRVMPFDDGLFAEFRDVWNGKYDRTLAWKFVYGKILYVYDMLYPVMDQFMPLGDLTRIEGAVDQLEAMISKDMLNSTLYMPVTRELSNGKRRVLEAWANLIVRKYPQQDI